MAAYMNTIFATIPARTVFVKFLPPSNFNQI